jgi:hypothetical protein
LSIDFRADVARAGFGEFRLVSRTVHNARALAGGSTQDMPIENPRLRGGGSALTARIGYLARLLVKHAHLDYEPSDKGSYATKQQ